MEKLNDELGEMEPHGADAPENEQEEECEPNAEPDYKQLFEEQKRYSRQWERKCKDNAAKVKDLEGRVADFESTECELQELRKFSWAAQIADETGVPRAVLELLDATTREEMAEKAAKIATAYKATEPAVGLPHIPSDGSHVDPKPQVSANDFLRNAFKSAR